MQSQRRLDSVAAGIATPLLSMLLYMVGYALRSHHAGLLASKDLLGLLVAAGIFGWPFAVPVSVVSRLRNAWTGVPFISAVAAIGIELQLELARNVPDSSPYSIYFMLIWFFQRYSAPLQPYF